MLVLNDLSKVQFPIFALENDNIEILDGIVWIDDEVVDDRNMPGTTLGIRRIQSPMTSKYPLKTMLENYAQAIKYRGNVFIDSLGKLFIYEKIKRGKLKYHKIRKQEKKEIATVLWVRGVPFPFTLPRPLKSNQKWAGILYDNDFPWLLYETCEEQKKDTWRKF